MNRPEWRRHARNAFDTPVEVSWSEPGAPLSFVRAKCVNLSASGMRIETPDAIPARTTVQFRFAKLRFNGSGTVRYCNRKGLKHIIGVEFGGDVRWDKSSQVA